MKSGLKWSCGYAALFAAAGLVSGVSASSAADLGGNCCADLEERIAELEATTARKGNRKVSLTISGWVNQEVMWWDDSHQSNVYVGDNALEQSRVRFVGEAKIANGWSAGYVLELGIQSNESNKWDQTTDQGIGTQSGTSTVTPVQIRKSNWFIKSKDYGQVAVGLNGTATYHLLDDADPANTRNFSDFQAAAVYQGAFFLRNQSGTLSALRWSDVLKPTMDNGSAGENGRRNVVRYDSPDIMGFVVTASWGEDDEGGVSLTYKNTFGDFKVIAKGGYETSNDTNTSPCSAQGVAPLQKTDCVWYGGGASVMHVPTGLYVYGAYGETVDNEVVKFHARADPTDTSWYIQAGIEQKWFSIGKTTIFGEYRHDDTGSNTGKSFSGGTVQDASLNLWAAGVIQNVAPAAMDFYLMYRGADGSITNNAKTPVTANIDTFSTVIGGALIQF